MLSKLITPMPSLIESIIAVLILLGFWLFQQFILHPIMVKVTTKLKDKEYHVQYEILHHYNKPFRYIFFITGLYLSLSYLFDINLWDIATFEKLYHSVVILSVFIGIYRILDYYANHPDEWKLFNKQKMNQAIFPFLCRFGKYSILVLAFIVISAQWGYNMNGLIAGLGIGGIALALGAKDVLSNIFGGTAVVLDKPFSIGDVISTENRKLQGTVQDINFRSTRLLTFDKEIIYVPNALLANQPIYNYSRRDRRRIRFHLSLSLETSAYQVRKVVDDIKSAIIETDDVESENYSVYFDEYTPTSINILVIYFTNSPDFADTMKTKEEMNFIIMNILKNNNVSLAPAIQHMNYNRNVLN